MIGTYNWYKQQYFFEMKIDTLRRALHIDSCPNTGIQLCWGPKGIGTPRGRGSPMMGMVRGRGTWGALPEKDGGFPTTMGFPTKNFIILGCEMGVAPFKEVLKYPYTTN